MSLVVNDVALVDLSREPWFLSGWSKHVSPSQLGRVAACPRSEAMPHAQNETPFSRKGTVAHKFLADCLEYGREKALALVEDPADLDWLTCLDVQRLPAFYPERYAPEIAFAYNPKTRTARELGRNLSRSEARGLAFEHELVGICDVAGIADDWVVVGDYKTGWGYVERAEINWQLKTYALFAARAWKLTGARYSVIRAMDTGFNFFDVAEMDELEMMAHEEELMALLAERDRVRLLTREGRWSELPPLNIGQWCTYCPASWYCPAVGGAAQRALGLANQTEPLTREQAADAWELKKAGSKAVERLDKVLRALAKAQSIPLKNGKVLGERPNPKESLIPEKVREVLVERWGQLGEAAYLQAADRAESMTKKALRSALRDIILDTLPEGERFITRLDKDVAQLLRERRAMAVTNGTCVDEHDPKKVAQTVDGEVVSETEAA